MNGSRGRKYVKRTVQCQSATIHALCFFFVFLAVKRGNYCIHVGTAQSSEARRVPGCVDDRVLRAAGAGARRSVTVRVSKGRPGARRGGVAQVAPCTLRTAPARSTLRESFFVAQKGFHFSHYSGYSTLCTEYRRITLCYLRTCVCSWLASPTGTASLWHLGAKLAERWHIRELGLCVLLGARGVRAQLLLYAVALRLEPEVAVGDLVGDRV